MESIRKFRIIVLVSNQMEYWSNYSIRFKISNIRTVLVRTGESFVCLMSDNIFGFGKYLPKAEKPYIQLHCVI